MAPPILGGAWASTVIISNEANPPTTPVHPSSQTTSNFLFWREATKTSGHPKSTPFHPGCWQRALLWKQDRSCPTAKSGSRLFECVQYKGVTWNPEAWLSFGGVWAPTFKVGEGRSLFWLAQKALEVSLAGAVVFCFKVSFQHQPPKLKSLISKGSRRDRTVCGYLVKTD